MEKRTSRDERALLDQFASSASAHRPSAITNGTLFLDSLLPVFSAAIRASRISRRGNLARGRESSPPMLVRSRVYSVSLHSSFKVAILSRALSLDPSRHSLRNRLPNGNGTTRLDRYLPLTARWRLISRIVKTYYRWSFPLIVRRFRQFFTNLSLHEQAQSVTRAELARTSITLGKNEEKMREKPRNAPRLIQAARSNLDRISIEMIFEFLLLESVRSSYAFLGMFLSCLSFTFSSYDEVISADSRRDQQTSSIMLDNVSRRNIVASSHRSH